MRQIYIYTHIHTFVRRKTIENSGCRHSPAHHHHQTGNGIRLVRVMTPSFGYAPHLRTLNDSNNVYLHTAAEVFKSLMRNSRIWAYTMRTLSHVFILYTMQYVKVFFVVVLLLSETEGNSLDFAITNNAHRDKVELSKWQRPSHRAHSGSSA